MPHELLGEHIGSLKEVLEENESTFGCRVEVGVQYLGGTTLPSSTLDEGIKDSVECALFCAGSSSCQFWTHDSDYESCELRSSEPTQKNTLPASGFTSGTRICGRSETFSQGRKEHFLACH